MKGKEEENRTKGIARTSLLAAGGGMLLEMFLGYVTCGGGRANPDDAARGRRPSAAETCTGTDAGRPPSVERKSSPPGENVFDGDQSKGGVTLLPRVPSAEAMLYRSSCNSDRSQNQWRTADNHSGDSVVSKDHNCHRPYAFSTSDRTSVAPQFLVNTTEEVQVPGRCDDPSTTIANERGLDEVGLSYDVKLSEYEKNGEDRTHLHSGTASGQTVSTVNAVETNRGIRSTTPIKIAGVTPLSAEDFVDDDSEVIGDALGKPMTPQSYSSLMLNGDFRKLNYREDSFSRCFVTGENRSLLLLQNRGASCDAAPSIHDHKRRSGNARSCPAYAAHSAEPVGGLSTSSPNNAGQQREKQALAADADSQTVCTCGLTTGSSPTEPFSGAAGPTEDCFSRKMCRVHGAHAGCKEHSSTLICEWVSECIPPEPSELTNVNAGRPRVNAMERSITSCGVAVRKSLDDAKMMLNNKYVVYYRWCLGVGSSSKVFLCYNLHEKAFYAMKVYNRGKLRRKGFGANCALNNVRREIEIMKKLRHPNILSLVEVIDDPFSRKIYLVLELAEKGAVMDLEGNGTVVPSATGVALTEAEAARTIRSVVEALMYVHGLGIVHRDVKPQNILLDAEHSVKLSDFGVSIMVDGCASPVPREGTVAFLPPEVLASCEVRVASSGMASSRGASNVEASSCQMYPQTDGEAAVMSLSDFGKEDADTLRMTDCPANAVSGDRPASVGSERGRITGVHTSFAPTGGPSAHTAFAPDCATPSTYDPAAVPTADFFKVDVFALGVTTYVLLMGRLPWIARSSSSQMKAIYARPDPFEEPQRGTHGSPPVDGPPDCSTTFLETTVEQTASQLVLSSPSCGPMTTSSDVTTSSHISGRPATKRDSVGCCGHVVPPIGREGGACVRLDAASPPPKCIPQPVRRASEVHWGPIKSFQLSGKETLSASCERCGDLAESAIECADTSALGCCRQGSNSSGTAAPTNLLSLFEASSRVFGSSEGKTGLSPASAPFTQAAADEAASPSRGIQPLPKHPFGRRSTSAFVGNNSSLQSWELQGAHPAPHANDASFREDLEGSLVSETNLPSAATGDTLVPFGPGANHGRRTSSGPCSVSKTECGSGELTSAGPTVDVDKAGACYNLSAEAVEFVRCCLKLDPTERSTMRELYEMPWLRKAHPVGG